MIYHILSEWFISPKVFVARGNKKRIITKPITSTCRPNYFAFYTSIKGLYPFIVPSKRDYAFERGIKLFVFYLVPLHKEPSLRFANLLF